MHDVHKNHNAKGKHQLGQTIKQTIKVNLSLRSLINDCGHTRIKSAPLYPSHVSARLLQLSHSRVASQHRINNFHLSQNAIIQTNFYRLIFIQILPRLEKLNSRHKISIGFVLFSKASCPKMTPLSTAPNVCKKK